MNGAGNGEYCTGEGGLLILLIFVEKKSEERCLELESIWIGKPLHYKGI